MNPQPPTSRNGSSPPLDLTCKQVIDGLLDYVDQTAPASFRLSVDHHLQICPSCTHYVASYRRTIALSRSAMTIDESLRGEVPLANHLAERLRRSIRDARKPDK